jgi:hypothetical protein
MSIFDEKLASIFCERCDLQADQNLNVKFHPRRRIAPDYEKWAYLCDSCFDKIKLCRLEPEETYKYRL